MKWNIDPTHSQAEFSVRHMFTKVRGLSQTATDHYDVVGVLSMHGIDRPVTLDARAGGDGIDPFGNRRAGVSARTTVNRKDFGLNWNRALESGGLLVGDEIDINLEIEAVLDQGARDAAA